MTDKPKKTIVVMDDEPMIRETIQAMLEIMGYSVVCTESGRETLDYFNRAIENNLPLSAMILDICIPGGMGGLETIIEIRKVDKTLPVFVVSGYTDEPVVQDPGSYGFTASICKPFMMDQLMGMIEKHVG